MSEQEREELKRTHVQHSEHKLKSGKEDLKKHRPEKLRTKRRRSRKHQVRRLKVLLVLLFLAAVALAAVIYNHYVTYPGVVERDTVRAKDRGTDYIELGWAETRNTKEYKIYVKEHDENEKGPSNEIEPNEKWTEYSSYRNDIKIEDLKKGVSYSFIVRADSEKQEGIATRAKNFKTKSNQKIKVSKKITKLTCSKPFKIDADARTDIVFSSSDPDVAKISEETGEIVITGPGTADITITAREDAHYTESKTEVELFVLDTYVTPAGGAAPHSIYHLDSDNCEVVKVVTGAGGAVVPQGLAYTGDKYIISYGMHGTQRIVSFDVDGDGKDVSVPQIALGHPNGFTYADENKTCYCVKGWTSRAVTYEPETGAYGTVNFAYGCSGIGYDRKEKLIYTCSRTAMVAYDISNGYSIVNRTGVVRRDSSLYTQDCGGHAGLMLRCLSGSNKHGINYIDIYDMRNGTYLGAFTCDLSEVESAIVNKDGFLEILANNSGGEDYIWRTDINIETMAEGIDDGE